MEFSAWTDVLIGFSLIFIVLTAIKFHQLFKFWRNSFYTEIYSSFIEFIYRRNNLKKMSKSYWLSNNFGPHRIFFQLAKSRVASAPQAYIIIILSSGIYLLQIKNYRGKIIENKNGSFSIIRQSRDKKTGKLRVNSQNTENPIKQINEFTHKWATLTNIHQTITKIIVLNQPDGLSLRRTDDETIHLTCRINFFDTIKSIHESQPQDLNADSIDKIYTSLLNRTSG